MRRELPIFPLPLVLFPGVPQSLHIFEPRYRQLLTDCLHGERRFGIVYVAAGVPTAVIDPEPALGESGCIARIDKTEALPDGRANIVTQGERRFVLRGWLPTDRMYRVGEVEEFEDEPEDSAEVADLATDVREQFVRVVDALGVLTDRESAAPAPVLPDDSQQLSFHIAAALGLEPAVKLQLLQSRSTTARLRRLAALLRPLATDAERRAAIRHGARGNGKGGAHPKIEFSP